MYLIRLIYVSKTQANFGPQNIESILEVARKKNQANNISGLLYFNSALFLQCLEGTRESVNETYQKILTDDRHSNIMLLDYSEISEREFNTWSMGYVPHSSLTTSLNIKYSGSSEFNPYVMPSDSVHQLMLALREHIPSS